MRFGYLAIAATGLIGLAGGIVLALPYARADLSGPVLVVAGPGADPDTLIRGAGGRIFGLRTAVSAVGLAGEPGFVARLRDAGAWLVLDAAALARFCGADAA